MTRRPEPPFVRWLNGTVDRIMDAREADDMSEPQITHSEPTMPDNTTTQTAAERLRASAERDRALADAATPGPWSACGNGLCECGLIWDESLDVTIFAGHDYTQTVEGMRMKRESVSPEKRISNTAFLTASRAIVPRQADQIRVLVEAITTTVEQDGWYESDTCGLEAFPWAENLLNALDAAWALEEA